MIRQIAFILAIVGLAAANLSKPFASVDYAHPFILGGEDADIEEFPYMCSLYVSDFYCGCTIINEKWILTAAHCDARTMRYGSANRVSNEAIRVNINRCIRHPDYTSFYHNDIMLCETVEKIEFSSKAQPVKLPPKDFDVPGSWSSASTAIGWGIDTVNL